MAGDSGAERGAHGVQHSRRRFVAAAGAVTAGAWAAPSIRTVAAAATPSAPTSVAFFGINQVTRSLYAVDVSTGAWTLIGSTGQTNPLGLAFNPDDGVLYGCQNNSAPEDATYTVDTATGTWVRPSTRRVRKGSATTRPPGRCTPSTWQGSCSR